METKYGEINSIWDFFEVIGKGRIANPEADKVFQIILIKVKCKVCGDILEIESPEGVSRGDGEYELRRHIELHKLVKSLQNYGK